MNDLNVDNPYYKIPFTDVGAAYVGRFVAVWSQIEFFMTDCTAKMLGIDKAPAIVLTDGTTAGPKFSLFCRLAKLKITDAEMIKRVAEFRREIGYLLEKRNHLMHGMWGYWVSPDYSTELAASFYPKSKKRELLIDDVPALTARAAAQTHNIIAIRQHLYQQSWPYDPKNPPAFKFSKSAPNQHIGPDELILLSELLGPDGES